MGLALKGFTVENLDELGAELGTMADGTSVFQVPAEDGTIQRAFENLDARMDAWLAEMKRIERSLASTDGGGAIEPEALSASTVTVEDAPPPAETSDPPSEPPPAGVESAIPVAETVESPAQPASASTNRECAPPPSSAIPVDPQDEALLATLDEQTAQAIRVMRRLCMNRKTVKQLLAEYEARKAGPPGSSTRPKSWFRRGK